jgi:hypothetical protein
VVRERSRLLDPCEQHDRHDHLGAWLRLVAGRAPGGLPWWSPLSWFARRAAPTDS